MSFIYIRPYLSVVDNNRCPISIYSRFLIALFVLGIGLTASVILKEFPQIGSVPTTEPPSETPEPVKGALESFPLDFELKASDPMEYQPRRYSVSKQPMELSDHSLGKTYPGNLTVSDDDRPALPPDYETMSEEELLKHGYIRHITVNGDRLNKLAEKYLHDESRWEEIFRANRNQLTNQAVVPIGIVLIIPAK